MARKYSIDGILESETFPTHIDLHSWVETTTKEQSKSLGMWNFLKQAGNYFEMVLPQYPQGVSLPVKVERGYCHQNNLLYAKILTEKHKDIVNDFNFVTGVWLRKRKYISNPHGDNYCIGAHSFMTYRGDVLDCTMLRYPPDFYEITQRFGISFQLSDVLDTFKKLRDENADLARLPVMEALCTTPYLKK